MVTTYRRGDGIEERPVGKHLFLVASSQGEIHHMNQMGAGIWRLLSEPRSFAEIAQVMQAAFPNTGPKEIRRDVKQLLDRLESAGLIIRHESTAPR